jgi:PAS domain-containing protein
MVTNRRVNLHSGLVPDGVRIDNRCTGTARREERIDRIEPRYLGLGELFFRMRDAVIVGDAVTGRVVLWNDAATTLFGYSQAEAADLIIEDLLGAPARCT